MALLYCLFRVTVRNDKNHRLTRFLLLSIMVVSATIPFLTIQLFHKEIEMASADFVGEIVSTPVVTQPENHSAIINTRVVTHSETVNYWAIIYTSIISLLLFRLLLGIYRVFAIIKTAEKHRFRKIILAVVKDFVQPFTFLNKVVLSEKDFHENKEVVVAHEYAHIRHKHAVDLLFCELFTTLHFFNPFMWLLRRDLKLVHEYQADEAVLNKGIDAQKYQLLVLEKAVGERRFAMAHHFTQKPIVKRLKMMTKTKRQKWGMVKMILFVPLIIVLLQAFARPDLITKSADFIPVRYTENKAEQWLAKWNIDKIGDGIFDPEMDRNKLSARENNILVILMNIKDEYLVQGEHASKESIKTMASGFLQGVNPEGSASPESIEKEIPGIGKVKVSEGWISYRNDIESSREAINFTLRQIGEAYLEAREAKAFVLFGKKYFNLDVEKQKMVNEIVPIRFSYETPKNQRTSTWLPFEEKPSPEPKPMELLVRYDGTIAFGSKTYENLDEFEHDLKVWKKELEAISKEEKTNHYYRVNATFEHGSRTQEICSKEISKINYMLWKQSMHVEQIHHVFPEELNKPGLEMDKLKARLDQNSELLIPEGFSPDGDGIHDFFEIKGIYPQYQDAKLVIVNNEGQKVFEKKNYGNTDIWGEGKEWWNGTSENGKLSVGNYNYKLELGNGEVKKGTLLLAMFTSSEQSSEYVKQGSATNDSNSFNKFNKYDVIITSDKLQAFNKTCTVENVKQKVEEALKSMGDKKTISVLSFSNVPQERSRAILNELNQIPFAKVSTTVFKLEPKPPSIAQHKILLKANGLIYMDEKEYNLNQFESKIGEIRNQLEETNVAFEVENDVTYLQSETVLNILRKANIDQVGYSVQYHSVRETEPGTKIGEPSYIFGYTWTGSDPVNLEKLKREADSFLSGKGNRSLYTSISPDKNATQKDIEAVRQVLLSAGFIKVEISKSRN